MRIADKKYPNTSTRKNHCIIILYYLRQQYCIIVIHFVIINNYNKFVIVICECLNNSTAYCLYNDKINFIRYQPTELCENDEQYFQNKSRNNSSFFFSYFYLKYTIYTMKFSINL